MPIQIQRANFQDECRILQGSSPLSFLLLGKKNLIKISVSLLNFCCLVVNTPNFEESFTLAVYFRSKSVPKRVQFLHKSYGSIWDNLILPETVAKAL